MKKSLLLAITACLVGNVCLAEPTNYVASNQLSKGGFVGPDTSEEISVKEVLDNGYDDMRVTLKGKVIKRISGDHYLFSDGTGQITVEIDHEDMPNETITPSTVVKLYGEVDKDHFPSRVKIDVKAVEIVKK